MPDFLFRGTLRDLDPDVHELTQLELERQYRRLILIPSESTAPIAVREALSSAFHNIYAEGYPDEDTRWMSEAQILDYEHRLAHYRRYSDPRYYKGVEYADAVEALARRRVAKTFAANGVTADDLYVNVQALSGAPANNAVYHALVQPGDTVMGMNLLHGGHLSHGSPVNRSGKYYNIVHYTVDPKTERIDYEAMAELAEKHKPKMLIGGFSSYPWAADWAVMRAIADSVGAYLLADIAHVAGLVAAGVYPSPIGHAHVVTTTTHKTLNGPRGALILTTDKKLAAKIDRAVFPGEQGGPHVNVFAALALAFKIAQTEDFKLLQAQVIKNCVALTERMQKRGLRIPFGGTNTHLTNVDVSRIKGPTGTPLSGDMAARILDLAGIVVNRNTIPGDRSALNPSGIRLGTPWITQRGFDEKQSEALADLIADLLLACVPYRERSARRLSQRAKIEFNALESAKLLVRELAENAGIDFDPPQHGYPHFYYLDDEPAGKATGKAEWFALDIEGPQARDMLEISLASDIGALDKGTSQPTTLTTPGQDVPATLSWIAPDLYRLSVARADFGRAAAWLRALSDGFVLIDPDDPSRKAPGPVIVRQSEAKAIPPMAQPEPAAKPFLIGGAKSTAKPLPEFEWSEPEDAELHRTPLFDSHVGLGAKIVPFAGWEMPLRYSSVKAEHMAVRQAAGLFDVTHMGVYQAHGPHAQAFLDAVCANHIAALDIGESCYTHFLDPHAAVLDDLIVYRLATESYLLVVNASNDAKNWGWLNAVKAGAARIDVANPGALAPSHRVELRDLRAENSGVDRRVDIALQGPKSRAILLSLKSDNETQARLKALKRFRLMQANLGGFDLVVSRTGYTGESLSFELFVHPDQAVALWDALLKTGETHSLLPCGLGARDSLRIEAGLPLYGHELAGPLALSPADAGFRNFVKTYKPWFIGRDAFLALEEKRGREVARFRFPQPGTRPAHQGDPITNEAGALIGHVTSCSLDQHGTLTGQAHVDTEFTKESRSLFIHQGMHGKALPKDARGTEALVQSRFPK